MYTSNDYLNHDLSPPPSNTSPPPTAPGPTWTESTKRKASHKQLLLLAVLDLVHRGVITSTVIAVSGDLVELNGAAHPLLSANNPAGPEQLVKHQPEFHLKEKPSILFGGKVILKNKDGRQADIQELNRLLTLGPTAKQRFLIERELKCLVSGERYEQNSAYYLDFKYKDSLNWVVIHDLRIEHRGRVAQIDHLLINRVLDIFVLETKNYYYGVKMSEEGAFLVWNGKTDQAIFKFAGPGRQPGGFLYWPKESHQRKCLVALRSAFLLPAFRAVNGRCRKESG